MAVCLQVGHCPCQAPDWAKRVAGGEVGFEPAPARRVCAVQSHGCGCVTPQSPSHPAQRFSATLVGFTVTSRRHRGTAWLPAFSAGVLQQHISLLSAPQNALLGFVESQCASLIYLPNTTLYFNPVLLDICISSLV